VKSVALKKEKKRCDLQDVPSDLNSWRYYVRLQNTTYFVCPVYIITVGENGSEVALALSSNVVMIVMVFCPSIERYILLSVERQLKSAVQQLIHTIRHLYKHFSFSHKNISLFTMFDTKMKQTFGSTKAEQRKLHMGK
jgi:flavin reductase (DIM6/NTAB) family NADH-FMN oxidoreductase RutF